MDNSNLYTASLEKVEKKILAEVIRLDGEIPYLARKNRYDFTENADFSWWTNGFWGGINWLLYYNTGNDKFKNAAEGVEEKLDFCFSEFIDLHHDVGFLWLLTAVSNYKLTKNVRSYERGIHAANILAARFNTNGNFLRAWNENEMVANCSGLTIIDSMMNISLLFWCSDILADPRFKQIAIKHADTVSDCLVREDGSVSHIGIFDPVSGQFIRNDSGQGFSETSSWSRGQAWGFYGFVNCYKHTRDPKYLSIAKKIANNILVNLSESDFIAKIDFDAPETSYDFDASASAIVFSGLISLLEFVSEYEKNIYLSYIEKIYVGLQSVISYDPSVDGIIYKCAVAYGEKTEKNVSLIYADYFYIEGLVKLAGKDIDIW